MLGGPRLAHSATTCTQLSIDCVVSQTSGYDTGYYPAGVPSDYSWYAGGEAQHGFSGPPSNFTSMTGWGDVYPQQGASNVSANVYMIGFKAYLHKKTGGWTLAQDQLAERTLLPTSPAITP